MIILTIFPNLMVVCKKIVMAELVSSDGQNVCVVCLLEQQRQELALRESQQEQPGQQEQQHRFSCRCCAASTWRGCDGPNGESIGVKPASNFRQDTLENQHVMGSFITPLQVPGITDKNNSSKNIIQRLSIHNSKAPHLQCSQISFGDFFMNPRRHVAKFVLKKP